MKRSTKSVVRGRRRGLGADRRETIPNAMPSLEQAVHLPEEGVATIASSVAVGAGVDLALDDLTTNFPLRAIGVQRDLLLTYRGASPLIT